MPKQEKKVLPGADNEFTHELQKLRDALKTGKKMEHLGPGSSVEANKVAFDNLLNKMWPVYTGLLDLSQKSVELIALEQRTLAQENELHQNLTSLLSLAHSLVESINSNPEIRDAVANTTQMAALETLLSPQGRQLFGNLILDKGLKENRYRTDRTLRDIGGIQDEATSNLKKARTREKTYNVLKYISCLLVVTAPLGLLFHSKSKKHHEKAREFTQDSSRLEQMVKSLNGRPEAEGETRAITASANDIKNGVDAIKLAIRDFFPPAIPPRPSNR